MISIIFLRKRLFAGTVPANKNKFAGPTPANKNEFAGTVPASKNEFAGTVTVNMNEFAGTIPANEMSLLELFRKIRSNFIIFDSKFQAPIYVKEGSKRTKFKPQIGQ